MGDATVSALIYGAELALVALSFSLTYRAIGFANFAHVQFVTLGAYIALQLSVRMPLVLAAVGAVAITASVAVAFHFVIFARLRRRSSATKMIVSTGVSIGMVALVQAFWGPNSTVFNLTPVTVSFFGTRISLIQAGVFFTTALAVLSFFLLLRLTSIGRMIRAVADDPDLVEVRGVNSGLVIGGVWAIAGGLAALSGVFLGVETIVQPNMGTYVLVPMFAAAIVGGIDNPFGALVGALLLSGLETAMLNIDFGQLLSSGHASWVVPAEYKDFVAFAGLIVVLLIRPGGIFATAKSRA